MKFHGIFLFWLLLQLVVGSGKHDKLTEVSEEDFIRIMGLDEPSWSPDKHSIFANRSKAHASPSLPHTHASPSLAHHDEASKKKGKKPSRPSKEEAQKSISTSLSGKDLLQRAETNKDATKAKRMYNGKPRRLDYRPSGESTGSGRTNRQNEIYRRANKDGWDSPLFLRNTHGKLVQKEGTYDDWYFRLVNQRRGHRVKSSSGDSGSKAK